MGGACTANPPCINAKTHKPLWHRKESDCPRHERYAETHPTPPTAESRVPAASPPSSASPPSPTPAPPRRPATGRINWSGATAQTEDAGDSKKLAAAEPKPDLKWLVDGPHTIELFKIVFGAFGRVSYVAADWLEVKEPPAELFVFPKPFAEAEIKADPNNYYSKAATWVCQNLFRSKTQEQAHHTISTVGFGAGMLGMFAGIGHWYWTAFKTSPKLKRNKEAAKQKREAARAAAAAKEQASSPPATTNEPNTTPS